MSMKVFLLHILRGSSAGDRLSLSECRQGVRAVEVTMRSARPEVEYRHDARAASATAVVVVSLMLAVCLMYSTSYRDFS